MKLMTEVELEETKHRIKEWSKITSPDVTTILIGVEWRRPAEFTGRVSPDVEDYVLFEGGVYQVLAVARLRMREKVDGDSLRTWMRAAFMLRPWNGDGMLGPCWGGALTKLNEMEVLARVSG